jgi:hypothetical protein
MSLYRTLVTAIISHQEIPVPVAISLLLVRIASLDLLVDRGRMLGNGEPRTIPFHSVWVALVSVLR